GPVTMAMRAKGIQGWRAFRAGNCDPQALDWSLLSADGGWAKHRWLSACQSPRGERRPLEVGRLSVAVGRFVRDGSLSAPRATCGAEAGALPNAPPAKAVQGFPSRS